MAQIDCVNRRFDDLVKSKLEKIPELEQKYKKVRVFNMNTLIKVQKCEKMHKKNYKKMCFMGLNEYKNECKRKKNRVMRVIEILKKFVLYHKFRHWFRQSNIEI